MSFPISPTNGQISVVNNVTYQYTAINNSWKRIPTAAVFTSLTLEGNVTTGNSVVAGNVYTDNLKFANGAAFVSTTIGNTSEIVANIPSGNNVGLTLVATGVSAGNYGSSTSIPTIVVDSKGRITSLTTNAVSTTITLSGTSGSGSVAGGGTLTFAGTYGVTATASSSTITVGTPQDLRTTASPTFAGLTSSGAAQINNTLGVTGVTSITNNTDSSSVVTGALVVAGGVGIAGNVFVGGTLTVANLQARGSTNIVVQDPMTYFQANVLYPWLSLIHI